MENSSNSVTKTTVEGSGASSDPKTTATSNTTNGSKQNNTVIAENSQQEATTTTEGVTQTNQIGLNEAIQNGNGMYSDEEDDAHYMDQNQILEYFEDYKDCTCCKGHVYNCEGEVCQEIGECYCFGLEFQQK